KSRSRNLCIIACTLVLLPRPAASKDEACWHLQQRSRETGTHDLYISPTAIKDICHTGSFTIIARAPDWKVYSCNDKTKKVFATTVAAFRGSYGSRKDYDFREDAVKGNWTVGTPRTLHCGSQQVDTIFHFMNKTSAIREEAKDKYEFKY